MSNVTDIESEWMEKIHYQDDHPALIKSAGFRFQFFDGNDRMTKSASAAISRDVADRWKPDSRHFGLHVIAMGSDESVGPNRNGDGWPAQALREFHPTFTKFGCFFREHKNRCQKTQGIGQIKYAAYNEPMSRVELILWGDKDKAAEEYEMAKAGKELSFSMSARMPYDRCSICDKKSRRQEDYCSHLKDNMLRYIPQLKKTAYAVNKDDLKFFDISKVGRRADRVATYIRYMFGDDMAKAASFGDRIITGADWAAMEFAGKRGLGSDMLRMFAPWESATLEKLAAAEAELRETGPEHLIAIRRGAPVGIPQSAILAFAAQDLPSIGGELAKRAMLLDFKSFSSLVSGLSLEDLDADNGFRKVAMDELPGIFGSMVAAGGCECGDAASMVAPDEFGCALSQDKDMIDNIIHEVGDNLGMEEGRMVSRAARSMDKSASVKVRGPAGDGGDVEFFRGMLNAYGYYAVKAAHIAQGVAGVSPHILFRAVPAMNQSIG
jgi:hypothetical protein